jgi:hypothetical protein
MIKIMSNYIRGDLLIYTNNGIKRLDKLSKVDDLVYNENNLPTEIDQINRNSIRNYYLYKIKTIHNIDNYYLGGTNNIYCIQNIPFDLKIRECVNFIENNTRICSPSFVSVNEITEFDYIGYPYPNIDNNAYVNVSIEENSENDLNDEDKYRFQGLVLLQQSVFELNNNLNKNTIGFLNKYLHNNNIPFEIFNNNIKTTIKFNINDIKLLTITEINALSNKNIKFLIDGFSEINTIINTNDKSIFYLLKNIYMKNGILLTANYMNNNYVIKIPQKTDVSEINYFIYDNYIWSKIKKITKSDKYNGQLFTLKLKDNSKFLTEIGIIS